MPVKAILQRAASPAHAIWPESGVALAWQSPLYTYDTEGNRLTRTRIASGAADDYLTEYTWDYRNRLTKIVFKNNGGTATKVVQYCLGSEFQ